MCAKDCTLQRSATLPWLLSLKVVDNENSWTVSNNIVQHYCPPCDIIRVHLLVLQLSTQSLKVLGRYVVHAFNGTIN